jgi:hypothetical protein
VCTGCTAVKHSNAVEIIAPPTDDPAVITVRP